MKLEKYTSYKDSGIEWLGEIPEHWKLMKLKFLANIKTGEKDTVDREDNGIYPFFVRSKDIKRMNTYSYDEEAVLTAGDGDIGKIFHYINGKFEYHQRVYKFSNFRHITGKYLFYYLHHNLEQEVVKLSAKTTVDSLRLPMLQNFNISIPLIDEQILIASFLDEKTAQIDKAISQKEKLIELLKERKQIIINDAVTKGLDKNVEFKNSGVEWIGKIPKHWTQVKLKWISKIYAGGTPDKDNLRYWENGTIPWIASGEVNQGIVTKPTTNITEMGFKNSSARWIPKDSLVVALAGQGKTKGMVAYLDIDTTGNQSLSAVIPNKKKISSKYLYYLIKVAYKELRGSAGEGQRDGLNLEKLGILNVVYPPKNEQLQIVEYIETQTTKIDKAISQKEKLIELLKERKQIVINDAVTKGLDKNVEFKNSGVEWIGEIPKHWEVRRLASIGSFSKGGGISRDKLVEKGLPAILYGDIYTKYNYRTIETKNFISNETALKAIQIFENDILLTGSGETKEDIGKCIVFKGCKAFAGGDIIIFKQNKADSVFLSYSLNSTYSRMQKMIMSKGEIIVHIYGSKLKELIIFLPPLQEQRIIVAYIETQTTKIDKAIELQQNYISKLKEYKATLIDSVVTGKVKICS